MIRGIGCDVVSISRIRKLLESRFARRFLQKAFHPNEVLDCTDSDGLLIAEKIASRWAAKEATYKALQLETFTPKFPEICITKRNEKIPVISLQGKTLEAATAENVGRIHLSLSHDVEAGCAFATVVCETRILNT